MTHSNEQNRFQRILALLSLGISDALNSEVISIDEAESLLYSPRMMRICEKIAAEPALIELIHIGTELDAIRSLLPAAQWHKSIKKMQDSAHSVLTDTEPSDPQLEHWFARSIEE